MSRVWRGEDVDAHGRLVAGPVDVGSSGVVFGDGSFDHAWCGSDASVGHEVGQHELADATDEVDDGVGDDRRGLDDEVAGGMPNPGVGEMVTVR